MAAIVCSRRSDQPADPVKPDKTNLMLIIVNLLLGLVVLLLSGYMDSVAP